MREFDSRSAGTAVLNENAHGLSRWSGSAGIILLALVLAPGALAERTQLKPGWNLFTTEQDVEMGRQVSGEAERELPMLKDRRVDDYLNRLGQRLAAKAPGASYPYQFKAVNDPSINAFALPGGFLYVNRGTIEAADNEAQLAGVIGHEIGHVALRHGTNQASKAYAMQAPLAFLGGIVGSNSIAGVLTQIGAGFAANSVLLKYSRDAERQADLVGTQILYDNNYDPRAMAQFFEKLEAESKGRPMEFFSSHPNPDNRVQRVNAEIEKLGGLPRNYAADTADFSEIQRYIRSLPAAAGLKTTGRTGETPGAARPPRPSERLQSYAAGNLSIRYPDNWRSYGQGDAFTLAPEGGIVSDSRGNSALAYGVIGAVFQPNRDPGGRIDLATATNQLVDVLRQSNPDMRISPDRRARRIDGQSAQFLAMQNPSPLGGNEVDWLVTVLRPEGLVYFIMVAPEEEFAGYQSLFQNMISSVRFSRR